MEAIQAFLKEYDHIPPNEKCMALLLAEERFLKIKQAMEEEQNQPEVLQELLLKLINDLQILKGIQQEKKKPTAQSSIPYWNSSMIDDEEARDNFLKDVCTFLRKFSHALMDKQYRQEDIQELMSKLLEDILVPILSELEGISDDTCDVPVCDDSSTFDALNDNSEILSNSNNDDTSSDDDDFEDVEYVSLEEVNDDHDAKEFDLEDILQIQDVILREKLLKVHRLISKIESLKVNSTPDRVLESPSSFPIFVADSDSFLEEGGGVWWDWRSDSTTTHVNYSLPEYESFHFDNSSFSSVPVLPESYSLMYVEICLNFESDTPVIDNFEKLNEDQRGSKNVLFQNVR
ncbi:hypothetical protein Tco_0894252 [Tanacetum coccineum]|uniref:Uncharacterized protein n=1 Tax=Tanacetum coccineum TaxID=301880 RepID=A0ABQ5CBA1_9ASTR